MEEGQELEADHKEDKNNKKKSSKGKSKNAAKNALFISLMVIAGVAFIPTTIVLAVGMLPTIVAFIVDRTRKKYKVYTVGMMNLTGCLPFIFDMWSRERHHIDAALEYIGDANTVTMIYFAAFLGYLIDWGMTGIVSTYLSHKSRTRIADIERIQNRLIEKWGQEVTGELPLDERGFPIVTEEDDD